MSAVWMETTLSSLLVWMLMWIQQTAGSPCISGMVDGSDAVLNKLTSTSSSTIYGYHKTHDKLQINSTCVKTPKIQLFALFPDTTSCTDLSFLHSKMPNGDCFAWKTCKNRFTVPQDTKTGCVMDCEKSEATPGGVHEVDLMYAPPRDLALYGLEVYTSPCVSSPCQHDGTCVDTGMSFTCICQKNVTGVLCETNFDNCNPNLCPNGGACTDGYDTYTCDAPLYYWSLNNDNGIALANGANISAGKVNSAVCQIGATPGTATFGNMSDANMISYPMTGNHKGTATFWLYVPAPCTDGDGFFSAATETSTGMRMDCAQNGAGTGYYVQVPGGNYVDGQNSPRDEWYHVTMVMLGNEDTGYEGIRVYHNGVMETNPQSNAAFLGDTAGTTIDTKGPGYVVVGKKYIGSNIKLGKSCMDEFSVWNRVLTDEEIRSMVNVG